MNNPDRVHKGIRVSLYFRLLTDQDIQGLIVACQEELELRSQEHMGAEENV